MNNKTVVVTGASRGVGLEVCRQLLQHEYKVVAVARTMSEALAALTGDALVFEPFDLSQIHNIHAFANKLSKTYGRVYGLVNNAGIGQSSILATLHESDISALLKVNLEAPILLTKYLLRGMLLNQQGVIVNISSIVAATGFNGLSVYGASKAGLDGFTRSLARETGKAGVRVNSIAPGYMQTAMTTELDDKLDKIARRSALKSLATPRDVADAVVYLMSESAARITGTTVTIDAGATA